jgi:hypothetical protein
MPSLLIRTACLTGLLVTAGITTRMAIGAEPADAPARRYEVELILFRHIDQSPNTPEIPAASSIFNPSPLDLTLADIPAPPTAEPAGGNPLIINTGTRVRRAPIDFHLLELDPVYPDFVPLREDTRTLMRAYERLTQINAYEPLLHIGWIQPARSTEDSKPFRFEPPTTDGLGISGTVTLYKERYLHLEVDLALEIKKKKFRTPFFFGAGSGDSPDIFKLTESRRIRGTVTHYFDGPQFGLITRVQEVRAAAAEREGTG